MQGNCGVRVFSYSGGNSAAANYAEQAQRAAKQPDRSRHRNHGGPDLQLVARQVQRGKQPILECSEGDQAEIGNTERRRVEEQRVERTPRFEKAKSPDCQLSCPPSA
jgi:hypothetical protein